MFKELVKFIRDQYQTDTTIALHEPVFSGNENKFVQQAISSTFVSSSGHFVNQFEKDITKYTESPSAVAVINGTAALHIALKLAGVKEDDCVITQPLTFIATCNAICYCAAEPIFIDVDKDTMGLSSKALEIWLTENAKLDIDGNCRRSRDDKIIRACIPMHTFGHPVHLEALLDVCNRWGIAIIEDAAEALGSTLNNKHLGTFGKAGILSFNGNKIITSGSGGMILTDQKNSEIAKHLCTTAKVIDKFEYKHDAIAYNYRLPNLNAALGCAQLQNIDYFLKSKRTLAERYKEFLKNSSLTFFCEPEGASSNYWLNAVICDDLETRNSLLEVTNTLGVETRPVWKLMSHLPMFKKYDKGELKVSNWLESRVVNLPSSPIEI